MTEPNAPLSNAPSQHAAPPPLWRAMRAFLRLLLDLFGEPGAIAADGVLSRRGRALMLPWLRAGEAFLRRLLFIEALALAPAISPSASAPKRAARARMRKLYYFYADKPEEWRVSFRLLQRHRRGRGGRGRRRSGAAALALPLFLVGAPQPRAFALSPAGAALQRSCTAAPAHTVRPLREIGDAWPLAQRFEAMLRAYKAPQAAARRLARMLVRDEAQALRALQPAPAHIADLFGSECFARCNAIVASRRRRRERAARADSS
jgi:hypothetical protein